MTDNEENINIGTSFYDSVDIYEITVLSQL
jgi:hypothetical protein